MPKILIAPLPDPLPEYDAQRMRYILQQIEQALQKQYELQSDADDKEAMSFFLAE